VGSEVGIEDLRRTSGSGVTLTPFQTSPLPCVGHSRRLLHSSYAPLLGKTRGYQGQGNREQQSCSSLMSLCTGTDTVEGDKCQGTQGLRWLLLTKAQVHGRADTIPEAQGWSLLSRKSLVKSTMASSLMMLPGVSACQG